MLDENQMIHPGRPADDGDAALDAALAAADQDMLSAISNGLDLDIGLARILQDLDGPPAVRPDIPAPARPGQDRRIPDAVSRTPSSRIHPQGADAASPARVAVLIREVNASDQAVQDQFLRARQAAGITARLEHAAGQAAARARTAEAAHLAVQAEHPHRRAPLPRQVTVTLGTVVLDGLACYLAARALGASGDAVLAWTVLFLAVLAGAEAAPGLYRDRGERARRVLAALTGFLVILAGTVLLAVTGTGPVPAIAGACLLTVITAGFLTVGYRALQAAETPLAWRAAWQAGTAYQAARLARAQADQAAAERDRLIDAYLGHLTGLALKTSPPGQQPAVESAARQYLLGELPWAHRPDAMPDLDAGRAAIIASAENADPGALAPSRPACVSQAGRQPPSSRCEPAPVSWPMPSARPAASASPSATFPGLTPSPAPSPASAAPASATVPAPWPAPSPVTSSASATLRPARRSTLTGPSTSRTPLPSTSTSPTASVSPVTSPAPGNSPSAALATAPPALSAACKKPLTGPKS